MKKTIYLALLMCFMTLNVFSQLITYANPPDTLVQDNPPLDAPLTGLTGITPVNYNVGRNTRYSVRVKETNSSEWKDLFVYSTFVNNTHGTLTKSNMSSFVNFDFSGSVTVEITWNSGPTPYNSNDVLIRPISKNIIPTVSNDKITFTLTEPGKFSVELLGDRYSGLHLFANNILNYPTQTGPNVHVYPPGIHEYDLSLNTQHKKIHIMPGAVLIVRPVSEDYSNYKARIKLLDNDEIYIQGGGILKGGIIGEDVDSVKIYGRGIIDLSNYRKQYDEVYSNYDYIRPITFYRCNNILIDGVTLNDSQDVNMLLGDNTNVEINNVKAFTRARWGDGIHMKGCIDVKIDDCFLRTSDDCISIYASRYTPPSWEETYLNRPALNITVKNTSLYADKAHPIEIGWHGNEERDGIEGLDIYNLFFNNIDILEHDELWIDPDGTVREDAGDFLGAISINCSDGNKCNNFLFKDIRVEDFSNGRLLSVNVESGGVGAAMTDGKTVENIRFENLSYNGSGEKPSSIKGINCERFVNGVHFENFTVNGVLIEKLSDYNVGGVNMFNTNNYAYNITFQEANNFSMNLASGLYTISNFDNNQYLQKNSSLPYVNSTTISGSSYSNNQVWEVINLGTGHYRIKNYDTDEYLHNSLDLKAVNCRGRYIQTLDSLTMTAQEWKIVGNNTTGYKINNVYTRGYLHRSDETNSYLVAMPKIDNEPRQQWKFTPYSPPIAFRKQLKDTNPKNINVYPNPLVDYININNLTIKNATFKLVDIQGRTISTKQIDSENSQIYVGDLANGLYLVTIEDNGQIIYSNKFIK
ncbi:glycosyl hydrolase family 28 protein [Flavobacterium lindanitolerans]|uniref:glycosyl hydrolase family 28 protein n=1 Tax=Flavobacterium lindanitolerans TaxID=428988 RepID=UPI0031E33CDC